MSRRVAGFAARSPVAVIAIAAALLLVPGVFLSGILHRSAEQSTNQLAAAEAQSQGIAHKQAFEELVQPFFKKYCVTCHGDFLPQAEINLTAYSSIESIKKNRAVFTRVLEMVRTRTMPPKDHSPKPPKVIRERMVEWLQYTLNHVDCSKIDDPGEVTLRRLNRVEYNNTIRDLIGVEFDPAKNFPTDEVGNGFDNQGAVLTVSPLLIDKYLDAAAQVADKAIVEHPSSLLRKRKSGGRLSTRGEIAEKFRFRKGTYLLRAAVSANQAGDEPARCAFQLDGKTIKKFEVNGENKPNEFQVTVKIKKDGKKTFGVAFLNDYYNPKAKKRGERDRNLSVIWLEIQGPKGAEADLPESHTRIITATPKTAGSVKAAAKKIFTPFMSRAFRRPAELAEVREIVTLVELAVERGASFEEAVSYGVQAVLVSPNFLFRVEDDYKKIYSGKAVLGDYELASRLSYFLWSSMPDEELFRLAAKGTLSNPEVLEHQVRRMLADKKSKALIENFFGQLLNLGRLARIEPNPRKFDWWNSQLQRSMRTETLLFCEAIVQENRPILDLFTADFTFVNPRLAELYEIKWKGKEPKKLYYANKGSSHPADFKGNRRSGHYKHENDFVRVSLPEAKHRCGVLTQGSILTLTSNPGSTSPVKRGKWILKNVLGNPPPPPPPGIPSLADAKKANPDATLREQLALHRSDPSCAVCHKVMDPVGFAFENFNVIGQWQEKQNGHAIDASGKLPDGTSFSGPMELIDIIAQRKEQIVRHFIERLMTYGLGRGLQPFDKCAVNTVFAKAKRQDYRISAIVLAIVESDPFRMTRYHKESP